MTSIASQGAAAPVPLKLHSARLREGQLLAQALTALEAGRLDDALLAAEYVCRRLPANSLPAILRATIIERAHLPLGARAWYRAWCCDPEQASLQDALLRAWREAGAAASVRALAPAFLPERCRAGTHAPLVALLRELGGTAPGACWKADGAIEAMVFCDAPTVRLTLSDGARTRELAVPGQGRRFRLDAPAGDGAWTLCVADGGAPLQGGPLVFAGAAPAPASAAARPADAAAAITIVIPVYGQRALAQACIGSVLASLPRNRRRCAVLVVDDAGDDPELAAWLDAEAAAGRLQLLRNAHNLGFIESVNRALRAAPGRHALLLNADTRVHGDWIDRLADALLAAPDIAAASPWSNHGDISSFPRIGAAAAAPDAAALAEIDAAAAGLACADVALPACCGFAMLLRASALAEVGLLDGVGLRRGYGEEVDWCRRAAALGWRSVAATRVFVAHRGSASFGYEKQLRVQQNGAVLAARYPDYYPAYHAALREDPLAAARAALAGALGAAGRAWLAGARRAPDGDAGGAAVPAALAGARARVAVWGYRAERPAAAQVLALARLIGARALPLRLLVCGAASAALWRTGVVDVLPPAAAQAPAVLSDAVLAGLAGCVALLAEPGAPVPAGLACTPLDAHFDPARWLAQWAGGAAAEAAR